VGLFFDYPEVEDQPLARFIENHGYYMGGVVVDGKPGVAVVFSQLWIIAIDWRELKLMDPGRNSKHPTNSSKDHTDFFWPKPSKGRGIMTRALEQGAVIEVENDLLGSLPQGAMHRATNR
jgi:hypothetical protein